MQSLKCLILSNHNDLFPLGALLHVGVSSLVVITCYGEGNNLRQEREKLE